MTSKARILVVDDEQINLAILAAYLEGTEFEPVLVDNCPEAWSLLMAQPHGFDLVLLDRLMPGMDGLELLRQIKATAQLRSLPVVMQTGASAPAQVQEGLSAGAYYYLTKPYEHDILLSILRAALEDRQERQSFQRTLEEHRGAMRCLSEGQFLVRTVEEACIVAPLVALASPRPDVIAVGLSELLVNGVEHGNLGISYQEKQQMKLANTWQEEVGRRVALPENAHKRVKLAFSRCDDALSITVTDEGQGFDWRKYLEFDPSRAFDPNGRGIAIAKALSFDTIEYLGSGNQVKATVRCESSCQE